MKPTSSLQRALRRLPLTTKQGPHNFYKGNRTGAMGRHTKGGGYVVELHKVRTYVCPDLQGFELTPFVWRGIKTFRDSFKGTATRKAIDGKEYIRIWKEQENEELMASGSYRGL